MSGSNNNHVLFKSAALIEIKVFFKQRDDYFIGNNMRLCYLQVSNKENRCMYTWILDQMHNL